MTTQIHKAQIYNTTKLLKTQIVSIKKALQTLFELSKLCMIIISKHALKLGTTWQVEKKQMINLQFLQKKI